jgi:hypothetical protein
MHIRLLLPLFTLLLCGVLHAQTVTQDQASAYPHQMSEAKLLGSIPALRDLEPKRDPISTSGKKWTKRNYFRSNLLKNPNGLPQNGDPLVNRTDDEAESSGGEVIPMLNFEGIRDGAVTPPDPSGDVGKDHYVQMVNTSGGAWFQVWDKEGNSVYGPALTTTIWDQVNGSSIGDPIIQYDHDAERWLMMEMNTFSENQVLIAISDDSDPTGSWKAYSVQCVGFPDYPKLYVWNNAYFITVNEIVEGNVCAGYALDRTAMLQGSNTVRNWRFVFPNFNGIQYQPATGVDWEMGAPPPPGTPGMIMRVYDDSWGGAGSADQVQMWEIHLNWQDTMENFSFGPVGFNVAPFETRVCFGGGLFDCLEQPDGANRITALENIIMYRAPYINYGTHESIVFNHVSDVSNEVGDGGDAAVRWYELRRNAGQQNWQVYQQGTYSPDLTNRFMSTLSLDEQGNIALGYSVVSTSEYPGLRITGRRNGDPLGQMTLDEYELAEGLAVHTSERWGDYSSMAIDPYDGKTFWFTGEYMPGDNAFWGTRVGSFQIRRDTYDIQASEIVAPVNSALLTTAESVTVRLSNPGILPASGFSLRLKVDNQILAVEPFVGTIGPNASATHTFAPTIGWNNIGDIRKMEVIAEWDLDQFKRNDTIRSEARKLTSFDAAITGRVNLPGLICTEDYTFGLLVKNTSGLPLDSVQVRWKFGTQPWKIIKWYGHLEPGQTEAIDIELTDITGTLNIFNAQTLFPNGQQDQDTLNDKTQFKIYSNIGGAYITVESRNDFGSLKYEVQTNSGSVINSGTLSGPFDSQQFCANDLTCYRLILSPMSSSWSGAFRMLDVFNEVIFETTFVSNDEIIHNFCTPARKQVDVGAVALISPQTGANLTNAEPVTIAVRNFGLTNQGNLSVSWRVENGNWNTETMTDSIAAGVTKSYTFQNSTLDASVLGQTYTLELKATLATDEETLNDNHFAKFKHKASYDLSIDTLFAGDCGEREFYFFAIRVTNLGVQRLDSVAFDIQVNDYITTMTFPLGADPDVTVDLFIQIDSSEINDGSNNIFKARIISVDTIANDDFTANNYREQTFDVFKKGLPISISIFTDENPTEITWQFIDAQNNVVLSGGPYTEPNSPEFATICLDKDSCYTFRLLDSGNNGMNGSIQIFELFSGGTILNIFEEPFTSVLERDFCAEIVDICTGFDFNYGTVPPSNNLNNGRIIIQANGGNPPYRYRLNGGEWKTLFLFNNLAAGTYYAECEDANGCLAGKEIILSPVSTNQPNSADLMNLTVSPNPTSSLVWVKHTALNNQNQGIARLYNQQGKYLRDVPLTRFDSEMRGAFSLEKSPAGLYLLQILDQNGRPIGSKRIIKS